MNFRVEGEIEYGLTRGFEEFLNGANGEDVTIEINSYGGDVWEGMKFLKAIDNYNGKVIAKCGLIAASMAGVIALACDEIICEPTSFVMLHKPLTFVAGNAKQLREVADQLDVFGEALKSYAAKKANNKDLVEGWFEAEETWFNAGDMAVNFNATVTDGSLPIVYNKLDMGKFKNAPVELVNLLDAAEKEKADKEAKLEALMARARELI